MRTYHISSVIRPKYFPSKKNSQKSKSRPLGLFRKGKTCITAKFHRTDLLIGLICSHSG